VAEITQPLQSIINIEKSRLPSHRIIPNPSITMQSERPRIGEVVRSVRLHIPKAPQPTGPSDRLIAVRLRIPDGGVHIL
ncbi:MAG TPA: hypothetical protein VKA03_04760, partial [Methylovirgula sp.]|nr:hypothetical protein [Methylovirgula sp.]